MTDKFIAQLQQTLANHNNLPAFTDYKGGTTSFHQVSEQISQLHLLYKETGLLVGDKVVLVARNQRNWAVAVLSILTYGAVAVPVMSDFKPDSIAHVIGHSDAKLLLVGDSIWENIKSNPFDQLLAVFSVDRFEILQASASATQLWKDIDQHMKQLYPNGLDPKKIQYHTPDSEDLAIINYTSGTTGFSKGVMLPYRSLWTNTDYALRELPELKPGDKIVSMLPLGHMFGLMFELFFCFNKGTHIHFLTRMPTPKIVMEAFEDIKPRFIITVPLVVEKIYKRKLAPLLQKPIIKLLLHVPGIKQLLYAKIRSELMNAFGNNFFELVVGGASFNPEIELFFKKIKFPFAMGYGMTECGPLISYSNWKTHKHLSCGKVIDCIEVKIDSPDPEHIVGEILTKGDHVMISYYKDAENTAAIIKNGWLHTGDLGVMDKDGHLFIRGRSKNLILGASGQNIYPEEIENILNNLPYVSESIVTQREHKLVALVFPDPDGVEKAKLSEVQIREIMEHNLKELNNKLPLYSHVAEIIVQKEEFEKTSKRSIKRFLYK